MKAFIKILSLLLATVLILTSCINISPDIFEQRIDVDKNGYLVVNGEKTEYKVETEPTIDVDNDGYLVVNGEKTEYKVETEPIIDVDNDGYLVVNGEKTEYKVETEPTIDVDNDGYLVVNGEKTEYKVDIGSNDNEDNTNTSDNELRIAVSPDYPPFESIADSEIVGIDVEIMELICERLGYDIVYVEVPYISIIPSIISGEYDCGMSAIPVTEDYKEDILFTTPYCIEAQCIVVRADSSITSKADLEDKCVAVENGTASDDICYSLGYDILRCSSSTAAKYELTNGHVDAWVVDNFTAKEMCEDDPSVKVIDDYLTTTPYAFAFNSDDENLVNQFDKIIDELLADGTIAEIFDKYNTSFVSPYGD